MRGAWRNSCSDAWTPRTTLEAAADADAGSPRYRADLAAAYVTRSERLGRADDLPRALSAAEAALQADPRLLEALFNKALVLEHLGLREDARDTWEEYLRHDGTSAWADEVRARVPHRPLAALLRVHQDAVQRLAAVRGDCG